MTADFIPFDPKNIIPEGLYWVVTQRKHGLGYLSTTFKNVGNKMVGDVSNQTIIKISKNPCNVRL